MPSTNAVFPGNCVPPVAAAYHLIKLRPVPVATKLLIVPALQIVCDALPVGGGTTVMVTLTANRVGLSHPFSV